MITFQKIIDLFFPPKAMIRNIVIPLAEYPSGTRTLVPFNLQSQVVALKFELRRMTTTNPTIWNNPETTVAIDLEISRDNGNTWGFLLGFRSHGGISINSRGVEAQVSSVSINVEPTDLQRRIRGSVTVMNGPIRTEGIIEMVT